MKEIRISQFERVAWPEALTPVRNRLMARLVALVAPRFHVTTSFHPLAHRPMAPWTNLRISLVRLAASLLGSFFQTSGGGMARTFRWLCTVVAPLALLPGLVLAQEPPEANPS